MTFLSGSGNIKSRISMILYIRQLIRVFESLSLIGQDFQMLSYWICQRNCKVECSLLRSARVKILTHLRSINRGI